MQDIRLDKPIRLKTLIDDFDEGGDGSLNGGNRAVKPKDSQLFLAAKYGGFRDANQDGNPFITFAADGNTLARFDASEWDIENSGRPETYFLAGDPARLLQGIRRAFALIANDCTDRFDHGTRHNLLVPLAGSGAAGSVLYRTGFDRIRWSESLHKFTVQQDKEGVAKRSAAPVWEAGRLLSGSGKMPPMQAPGQRKIYTSVIQSPGPVRTVEFTWQTLAAAQRTALDTMPGHTQGDGLGK